MFVKGNVLLDIYSLQFLKVSLTYESSCPTVGLLVTSNAPIGALVCLDFYGFHPDSAVVPSVDDTMHIYNIFNV